nr:hypothetical protein [uncultured Desulfobulbus sp.]
MPALSVEDNPGAERMRPTSWSIFSANRIWPNRDLTQETRLLQQRANTMKSTSKRHKIILTSLLLLSLLASPHQMQAENLRLLYNNDNMGELDGCG